ncbi:unnamed protein product [Mytilus coruscus]|uniref:Mab-21-like HhH/H2TH-like domain-containing protein n=1 Tax=Mytilus coruscus TaxID=42192 RepID=A0A6J8B169_MYTCO|nr:unnamed protein product [Mytilus coruscus]
MRKITYWEIYGVTRFPYRGRRKFTPLLYQSFDGGMIISNDVFGLTIRQFERMYKECLDRRKTKEQWILNLRYPDKSSNEYLEYLQNCTDCNKDHLLWPGHDPREKYLYDHLVETVGTEIDIRSRQRLFITQDIMDNVCSTFGTNISSGSLAEGLDLPGSDQDIMFVRNDTDIVQNVRNIKHPVHRNTFVMETDIDHPGFTRLKCVAKKIEDIIYYSGKRSYARVDPFIDKINQSNKKILLCVLESIKCGGIDGLIANLFQLDNANHRLLSTQSEISFVMFEYLFFRIGGSTSEPTDISSCFKGLAFTEYFIKSESSTFIIDVCKYRYAELSQYIAQLLPSPNTRGSTYNIHKRYHRHLQDGIKTDAVSGWLLYASFYYVIGQYNVTLRLTDYILSRCTPGMRDLKNAEIREKDCYYRLNELSTLTLIERMRISVVNCVTYLHHSSLIPEELQLEVNMGQVLSMTVPPVVLSHCLRFLCHHHLGDIFNKQALRNLYLTVKNKCFMTANGVSESMIILGVCCELSGDKDKAYYWYDLASQCPYFVRPTAKIRKSKLFEI